ncbi:MAG: DUF2513 domain-containing protein [Balneola sp.]
MKRDFALIKEILLQTEANPKPNSWIRISLKDFSEDQISYNTKLLHEAGLVEAIDQSGFGTFLWTPVSLTWEGHDFLDNAKNETVWKRTLALVKDKSGSISFNIFQNLLQNQATKLFEGL